MRAVWGFLAPGLLLTGLLAGCGNQIAERQAELSQWVGQPETTLLAAMGAPNRSYDSGQMKFLTYEDHHTEVTTSGPTYFGPSPYWYGPVAASGLPAVATTYTCDTTFTIVGGVVRAFSLRGNGCG